VDKKQTALPFIRFREAKIAVADRPAIGGRLVEHSAAFIV